MREALERLDAAGIRLVSGVEIPRHFLFERGGFAALVERTANGFGNIGGAGKLLGSGFGVLWWNQDAPHFKTRVETVAAGPGEVDELRRFAADLEAALRGE